MKCSVGARRTWLLAMAGLTTLGASITVFAAPPTPANTASATSSAGPGPITAYMRKTRFPIPFNLDATGIRPAEVHLYVSRDGGGQWQLVSRQTPAARSFDYDTQEEGTFWFATRTIDTNGVAHPGGSMTPQLRITVDATRPTVEANADADGNGQLILDYNVQDISANEEGVRVEYMTDAGRAWLPCTNASRPISEATNNGLRGRMVGCPMRVGTMRLYESLYAIALVTKRCSNVASNDHASLRIRFNWPATSRSSIKTGWRHKPARIPLQVTSHRALCGIPGGQSGSSRASSSPANSNPANSSATRCTCGWLHTCASRIVRTHLFTRSNAAGPIHSGTGAEHWRAELCCTADAGPGVRPRVCHRSRGCPQSELTSSTIQRWADGSGMTAPNMPSAPAPGQGFGQGQAYVPGQLPPAGASAAPDKSVPEFHSSDRRVFKMAVHLSEPAQPPHRTRQVLQLATCRSPRLPERRFPVLHQYRVRKREIFRRWSDPATHRRRVHRLPLQHHANNRCRLAKRCGR